MIDDCGILRGTFAILVGEQVPQHHLNSSRCPCMLSHHIVEFLQVTGWPRKASQIAVPAGQEALHHSKADEARRSCHENEVFRIDDRG